MSVSSKGRFWRVKALSIALAAAWAVPAVAQEPAGALMEAMRLQGDAQRGKEGFGRCVGCHRSTAAGRTDGAVPRLSGQHATVVIKQVADIRSGLRLNPDMKPFVEGAEMNPQLLADIAVYLQALPIAGTNGKGPGTALERGKAVFTRECSACHGANGEGLAAGFFPMLASQHYGYLLRELELIRDGKRGNSNPTMVQALKGLATADMEAVSDYLSRLPPPAAVAAR